MTEKSKTWRSTTTTTRWSSTKGLTREQRDSLDSLLDGAADAANVRVSEQWSYASGGEDGPFKVEIKDGAVTVNGQRYDSLDEVPRADRERIEALRGGLADGGLWDMLKNAGIDIGGLAGAPDQRDPAKPEFIIETDIPDVRSAAPAVSGAPQAQAFPASASSPNAPAPGAVPRSGGGLLRMVLVVAAVGLVWWVLRLMNVV
ncbi:hypothetical protein [Achromobacter sp. UMC71]|uniref:hypothetical protein n=1 Tax=Achromobacter sp. UMC71 TaxID=1862320 RepID=UPI0016017EC2|nr:hypothetical protein [Achromobacter sp. UMC71]MBB1627920.1 hypothetical protein [Achromobacter sp. UMC71]